MLGIIRIGSLEAPNARSYFIYRDIVTSHLREDTRIRASVLATRRIYANFMYDVYICIYSGLTSSKELHEDLVTCLVIYKEENLRLMFKMWTDEIRGDRNVYIETVVARLLSEGKNPHHLVHDAKKWTHIPFTLHDRAALRIAGIELPKELKNP